MTTDVDVAIVGGGISGLTAARALVRDGFRVRLFERAGTCGGVIHTDRAGGFVIDTGPDTLLTHKPGALTLVRELSLEAHLVRPLSCRATYVLRNAVLRTLPETSALGLPVNLKTLAAAGAFSWPGKLRMAAEPFIPPAPPRDDESISAFVRRRFGREAVNYVAEPVLAGIHRGEADALSMRALFPALAAAERRHGSVARAWRRMPAPAGGGSMSLRGGLGQLASAASGTLPPDAVVTGKAVWGLERRESWTVMLGDASTVSARAVVLATPAYATGRIVRYVDAELSRLCGTIRYAPSVTVALGYRRRAIRHPLKGWGFMVPARERRRVRSATWVSSKWPDRAPPDHALIRVSFGGASDLSPLDQPDDALVSWAHDDLAALLRITEDPVLARVYRRRFAMPQLEVGHLERMDAIDAHLASLPGLFVSAAGFRGVGLPDCINDAERVAGLAAAQLRLG